MVQTVIMMLLFSAVPILASSDIGNVDAGDLMGKVIGIIIYLFFWVGLWIALMALRFLVDSLGLGVEIVMPE